MNDLSAISLPKLTANCRAGPSKVNAKFVHYVLVKTSRYVRSGLMGLAAQWLFYGFRRWVAFIIIINGSLLDGPIE